VIGPEELRARVAELRWFHTIDLGHGIVTPGHDDSPKKLRRVGLPEELHGKTVLDIGAWDGFFSFEAERRGAARVVAVDPACWRPPEWGPRGWGTKAGFDLAHRAQGSGVESLDIDLAAISPSTLGQFDVVLFLGVFYHLPDPWPVLERAASVTRGMLIVETHADLLGLRRPAMAYYPGSEVDGDESTYWGPNGALLTSRLRELDFARVEVCHGESLPFRVARSLRRRARGSRFRVSQGRLTIHASR
jgi:tRNA (mo5U34)-methyltransferase